jgi:hypothetical protein
MACEIISNAGWRPARQPEHDAEKGESTFRKNIMLKLPGIDQLFCNRGFSPECMLI